jgi:pyruvate formate lyase activating enzyme
MQPEFLAGLLERCKARDYHTAVDTCGYAPPAVVDRISASTDLFLFDLKLMDDAAHVRYTGVSNKPVLENLGRLAACGRNVVVRFPVVPGITDSPANVSALIAFMTSQPGLRQVSLLPFHHIGDAKYQRLGIENRMAGAAPPADAALDALLTQFERNAIHATIGA